MKSATHQFIEDAIAGGYRKENPDFSAPQSLALLLLDPLAWQAVGKTRGWEDGSRIPELERQITEWKEKERNARGEYDYWGCVGAREKAEEELKRIKRARPYHFYWHRFIDHLADGKTIEEALAAISV